MSTPFPWLRLYSSTMADPRLLAAASELRATEFAVLGALSALMLWAGEHAQDGLICATAGSNEAAIVERAIGWRGQAGRLYAALVRHGLLAVVEGGVVLADWQEQQGKHVEKLLRDRAHSDTKRAARKSQDHRKTIAGPSQDGRAMVARESQGSRAMVARDLSDKTETETETETEEKSNSIPVQPASIPVQPAHVPEAPPVSEPDDGAHGQASDPGVSADIGTQAAPTYQPATLFALEPAQPPSRKPDAASQLVELWNASAPAAGLSKCQKLTPKRAATAKVRLAEQPDLAIWAQVAARIAASAFCCGRVPARPGATSPWRADFDWMLQPDAWVRVLEGKYDDAPSRAGTPLPTKSTCVACPEPATGDVWGLGVCFGCAGSAAAHPDGPKAWAEQHRTRGAA